MDALFKKLSMLLVVFMISSTLFIACGDDDDDSNEHGKRLQTQAVGKSASLNNTYESVTTPMHDARISVTNRDFSSAHCTQVIEDVYAEYPFGFVDVVGLINNHGEVVQSTPIDQSGQDRWDDAVFQSARDKIGTQPFASSDLIIVNEDPTLERKAEIMMFVDDGAASFHGVLYLMVEVGWAFDGALDNDENGAHEDRDVFVLDYDNGGTVLDCRNATYIGQKATDLGEEFSALWQEMVADYRGYSEYLSDNLPGSGSTGGQRTVGWSKVDIYDQEWVVVITEPK